MSDVGFNASDPVITKFLSALALGETGGATNAATLGTGGADLSGASHDVYGFPDWSGNGASHAAGIYQFQPGTWDSVAAEHNLDFANPTDQSAGAWYEAQKTYAAKTGGSLYDALKNGDYSSIQQALADVWPSVQGNSASPQGLSGALENGQGANLGLDASSSASSDGTSDSSSGTGGTGIIATIENFFVRGGLIIIGGIIVIVALWYLLSQNDVISSPGDTAKAIAKGI